MHVSDVLLLGSDSKHSKQRDRTLSKSRSLFETGTINTYATRLQQSARATQST